MSRNREHIGQRIVDVPEQPPRLVRDEILDTARTLINGDRRQTYGDATVSFSRIASLWTVILDTDVSPGDVARCMVAMKLARLSGSDEHRDSWIDIAGYAALGAEVAGA